MRTRTCAATALAVAAIASGATVAAGGCAARPGAGTTPQQAPPASPQAHGPVYRYIPVGGGPQVTVTQADGTIAGVSFGGDRFVVSPDGKMATAGHRPGEEGADMGAVSVPGRLGGGYLFWSFTLFRARTFLAPLEPVAPLATNVIDVAFGHDSMLVYGPNQQRRAYALDPPRRLPLSPHGVIQIGGADDDRVLAIDAAGRALASVDGGKTWKDMTTELGGQAQGVLGQPTETAFVMGKDGAWLKPDGSFERRPLPAADLPPWAAAHPKVESKAVDRLYRAMLAGRPRPDGRVDLTEGADAVVVDLATGEASERRQVGPDGSSCMLLTSEGEGLATCHTYSVHAEDGVDVISHALGAAPRVEKTFSHHPQAVYRGGALVVVAPCESGNAGARPPVGPTPDVVCVRRASGTWDEVNMSAGLGTTWKVLTWLATESGDVAAILWEQGVRGRKPGNALLDVAHGTVIPLDAEIAGLSTASAEWVVRRDGSIRGFTQTGTVSIDAKGHVVAGPRLFADVASAGDHALARDAKGALWQTADGGASWVEVATPPVDVAPIEPLSPGRTAGSGIRCGLAGCALAHPSRVGSWLRVGWPSDPPVRAATASKTEAVDPRSDAGAIASMPAGPAPAPAPRLPKLVCKVKAELKPRSEGPPIGAPGKGADRVDMLGGWRVPNGPADREFASPTYRDRFDGPVGGFGATSFEHALRAALHFETGPGVGARRTLDPAGPIEGFYVETFDPTGRIRHAVGTLGGAPAASSGGKAAAPPAATAPRPPRGPNRASPESEVHPARPVLAAGRPGEAAGVLVSAGDRNLWITPSGAVRATAGCQGKFEPFGGMLDARGKLWIACEDDSHAVDIIDAETGQTRLHLPPLLPWVWEPEAKFPLYGGGRATFLPNPDAIAVGADGKVAVLRLPSVEPATVDDPAWLLTPDAPPVELAPWSTLESATSSACLRPSDAFRVLVQTPVPWVTMDGSLGFRRQPGMTALVRWGRDRVCLEAVELGDREIEDEAEGQYGVQVMAVARFTGAGAGAGLVGMSRSEAYRAAATCTLEPVAPDAGSTP